MFYYKCFWNGKWVVFLEVLERGQFSCEDLQQLQTIKGWDMTNTDPMAV